MFGAFKKVGIELADEMRAARLAMRTNQHNRDWAPLPDLTTESMVNDLILLVLWSSFELYHLTLSSINVRGLDYYHQVHPSADHIKTQNRKFDTLVYSIYFK